MASIFVGGEEKPLDHLQAISISCPCKDIGRDLLIYVHFSTHCYSKAFDSDEHGKDEIICSDGPGRERVFCPIRYGLSPRLPDIIPAITTGKVHQTPQQRNYVYVVPLQIEQQLYEIYFALQRAQPKDKADLRMTVESAYPVDVPSERPNRPNNIRFQVLAYKVLRKQAVRFGPR